MQQKLLLGILCGLFSVPFAYAADGQPKTADPKPIKVDSNETLFRIRIFKNVPGLSPEFTDGNQINYPAKPGDIFDVVGKKGTNYVVVPIATTSSDGTQKNTAYTVPISDIDNGYGVVRQSLVSGMFIAPFKYYPRSHSFATTSLTVAPYVGYETNVSTFTAVCKFFSSKSPDDCFDLNWVQKYTYFVSLGPSFVSVTDQNNKSSQVVALSAAIGVAYDFNKQVKFLLATGKDWTGSTATPYKYNALPWFAVTLGYSF